MDLVEEVGVEGWLSGVMLRGVLGELRQVDSEAVGILLKSACAEHAVIFCSCEYLVCWRGIKVTGIGVRSGGPLAVSRGQMWPCWSWPSSDAR